MNIFFNLTFPLIFILTIIALRMRIAVMYIGMMIKPDSSISQNGIFITPGDSSSRMKAFNASAHSSNDFLLRMFGFIFVYGFISYILFSMLVFYINIYIKADRIFISIISLIIILMIFLEGYILKKKYGAYKPINTNLETVKIPFYRLSFYINFAELSILLYIFFRLLRN